MQEQSMIKPPEDRQAGAEIEAIREKVVTVKSPLKMPHKRFGESAMTVRLNVDPSPALAALVNVRDRLLEIGDGFVNLPEGLPDTLSFDLDDPLTAGTGDFTYRLRVTGLDRILSATVGATEG